MWVTYVILIALVLFAALAGIVFAFRNSPLLYWKEFVRLNYVTNSLSNRLNFFLDAKWSGVIDVFLAEAKLLEVRVLIIDANGSTLIDSSRPHELILPKINNPSAVFKRTKGNIRIFRDDSEQYWFYQISPINESYYVLSAIKRPSFKIGTILQDDPPPRKSDLQWL